MGQKVVVLGLDCVPPSFLFGPLGAELPNLSALVEGGLHGALRSCAPPITVPAWSCMFSGRDPGELGLYGFRTREAGAVTQRVVHSGDVLGARVWDRVGAAGGRTLSLFVPPSHPPPPIEGALVSCLLTPGADSIFTEPRRLGSELRARFGDYRMDVADFRKLDGAALIAELSTMTAQHFDIARYLYTREQPDLMLMVEVGTDRLHHGCYHLLDPDSPAHDGSDPLREAAVDYYRTLDRQVGEFLSSLQPGTAVIVASDHGARPLHGAIAVNQWLMEQGYLCFEEEPTEVTPAAALSIDWARTRAWAEGGYYARIHLNRVGREPRGIVAEADFEAELEALSEALGALPGRDGEVLSHRLLRPQQHYRACRGQPPDLMAFFGDLDYRAIATVGPAGRYPIVQEHNDSGPDACNHDWDGVFVLAGARGQRRGVLEGAAIYDVHQTILGLMGIDTREDLLGVDRSRGELRGAAGP
ncbi:MAG: alkaline phosphatase family protein [Myxococcales bacterium]|nr:alkaline phosphatase family protein [Myxococcales bacterium]